MIFATMELGIVLLSLTFGPLALLLFAMGLFFLIEAVAELRSRRNTPQSLPTLDLIDWPAVLDRMDSLDCKLAALLDEKDTVMDLGRCCKCGDESGICPENHTDASVCPRLQMTLPDDPAEWGDSGVRQFGACVGGPSECQTKGCPQQKEDMMKPTDGPYCRWEWKPEEYQSGDWSDAEFRKAMVAKGFTLSAEAAVDPADLPPSQTLGDAELVQMIETFGGVLAPPYKKGGPESTLAVKKYAAPTETLGECDLRTYLSDLQAMRMGREAEIGDGGCCGGGSGSGSMAHPQPKVLPEGTG